MKKRTFDEVSFDELDDDEKEQYFLYFHKLPLGNLIKIGISQIARGNYHKRCKEVQRYFAEDVECLGIELSDSKADAEDVENQLKSMFDLARPNSELIFDSPEVRDYIQQHCFADVNFVAEMSHIAELQRNRNR